MSPATSPKSLTELLVLRAGCQPNAPAFQTYLPGTTTLFAFSYGELAKSVDLLCWHYHKRFGFGNTDPSQNAVVAVLTEPGIWSFVTELALQKLGHTPLLLSTNNSVAAIAHLVKQTGATGLLHCDKYTDPTTDAIALLQNEESIDIPSIPQFTFDDQHLCDNTIQLLHTPFNPMFTPEQETARPAVILHSSGSTGFPKPLAISHRVLLATAAKFLPGSSFNTLPSFHTFGHAALIANLLNGDVSAIWPRHLPFSAPNVCALYAEIPKPPQHLYCVPYFLKLMAESPAAVDILTKFDVVWFGGAPLPEDLGNKLTAAGVHLTSGFGATEFGFVFWTTRDYTVDHDWNWLRIGPEIAPYIRLEEVDDGDTTAFNLVILPGWHMLVASNRADGSYDTKDLFVRHPTEPQKIKYLGRRDDTITQTLGEKTNPVPMERTMVQSPLVTEAIVFGDQRAQCGVLLVKAEGAPANDEEFIDAVWPVLQAANQCAPTHSRIDREMVRLLPHDTQVPRTPKLSIIRAQCYRVFAQIIENTYKRLESNGNGLQKVHVTDSHEMRRRVFEAVMGSLGRESDCIKDDEDLFAVGIDSLKATKVRNALVRTLDLGNHTLGQNAVYDHPTVSRLAAYLVGITTGAGDSATDVNKQMTDMVARWTARIALPAPASTNDTLEVTGEVVVLTGATGSMGAHILAELVARDDVARVVCLARAADHTEARARVQSSLTQRCRHAREDKWKAYASDVNREDLGLQPAEYAAVRDTATAVMHIAWPVNFRLGVGSFEEHVGGAVHLLNLTLRSPRAVKPSYYFASSISTQMGEPALDSSGRVREAFPVTTRAPLMGYGQSKWVTEKILEIAGARNARANVLRIGQLVGDKHYHGVWNETEAPPLMIRSANVLGALPLLPDRPAWLPVDEAARASVEVLIHTNRVGADTDAGAAAPHARLYHIVNPEGAPWHVVLDGLRQGGLKFETVSPREWYNRLRTSQADVTLNPTYKLLDFYAAMVEDAEAGATLPLFATANTATVSSTIAQTRAIDADIVARWVVTWADTGFLTLDSRERGAQTQGKGNQLSEEQRQKRDRASQQQHNKRFQSVPAAA